MKRLVFRSIAAFSILIGIGAVLFVAQVALAQVSVDLPTSFAGFSSQDLKVTIANIVRIILGFIGILFLLLILYGGFIWMTSQGVPDKINRAKKIIASAVIGLLIVLSSYAIAGFIIRSLQEASSPGGPGTNAICGLNGVEFGEQCDDGNNLSGDGCSATCQIEGIIPGCALPTVPGAVKVCSVTVPAYRTQTVTIQGYNFGATQGTGTVQINGMNQNVVVCGGTPSWSGGTIVVELDGATPLNAALTPNNVVVTRDGGASCDAGASECGSTWVQDGTSPYIRCMTPNFGPSDGSQEVRLEGSNFGTTQGDVEMEGALPSPANRFFVGAANINSWSNDEVRFDVPAAGAPQQAISGNVILVDSGNVQSNAVPFYVTCTVPSSSSAQCATGCCTNSLQCQVASACLVSGPGAPVITSINPNNGEEGNYVTVNGSGFGPGPGTVHFLWTPTNELFNNYFPTNPQCTSNWSDSQIIIEVPPVGGAGDGPDSPPDALVWVTTAAGDSNQVGFTINDIVRPGLCRVDPDTGFPGATFDLHGNNLPLVAPRDIFFGQPATRVSAPPLSQNYTSALTADATVPNLTAGGTTVSVEADGEFSNPLNFTVLGTSAGDPIINSFNPGNGPVGTYVTIMGANFGTTLGRVFMRPQGATTPCAMGFGSDCLMDVNFPPMCGGNFWQDHQVTVKVPNPGGLGNYFFILERADGVRSQPGPIPNVNSPFVKDTSGISPGICRVDPVGGPAGTPVNYYGENFGNYVLNQSNIWFDTDAQVIPPFVWNDTQVIGAQVPASAVTGTTTVEHANGQWGNKIPFFVGSCTSDAQCGGANCCSGLCRVGSCTGGNYDENNWVFTSGQYPFDLVRTTECSEDIQSPSPFPYDHASINYDGAIPNPPVYSAANPVTNAPVDVAVAGRFTRPLDFSTVIGANATDPTDNGVRIYRCTNPSSGFGGAGCTGATEVTSNGTFTAIGTHAFMWDPSSDLQAETWYEIRMDTNGALNSRVRATDGSFYEGSQFFGPDPLILEVEDFRWHFRTRSVAQGRCEIANVSLTPGAMTAPVGGTSGLMSALATSAQCYICGGNYTYAWDINPIGPPFATFSPLHLPTDPQQQFVGQNVTPVGNPTNVRATLTNNPSGTPVTSGPALLSVEHIPPYVVQYSPGPSCQQVPTNVSPYAIFNVDLRASTITTGAGGTVNLYRCTDGSACTALVLEPSGVTYNAANRQIDIDPNNANLLPETWYRVILTNGILNTQGQPIDPSRLNYPAGSPNAYSWTFQTSSTPGDPTSILITPPAATIPSLGGTQGFTAYAQYAPSTACQVNLNPTAYTWEWYSNDSVYVTILTSNGNQGTAQGIRQTVNPVTIVGWIPALAIQGTADVTVLDSRDPIALIGHRPDSPPGTTPPEDNLDAETVCDLNGPPGSCTNQCRNVAVSAFFSTSVDPASFQIADAAADYAAFYSFDNGNTTQATDLSVNAVHGTLQGDAAPTGGNATYPALGRGLRLTTTGYARVPHAPGVNDGSTGSITVAGWFKLARPANSTCMNAGAVTGTQCTTDANCTAASLTGPCTEYGPYAYERLVSKAFYDGVADANLPSFESMNYLIQMGTVGDTSTYVRTGVNTYCGLNSGGNRVPLDQWTFVAMTYDGSTLRSFVNEQMAERTGCGGALIPDTNPLGIGAGISRNGSTLQNIFHGEIDHVRIYNRALTPTEVNQLRLASIGQSSGSSNFYVSEFGSGRVVPGSLEVRNYEDRSVGVCAANPTRECTSDLVCQNNNEGVCNYKRGRVDFIPNMSTQAAITGLVARYTFDDGSAADVTGNGHDGTLVGGVSPTSVDAQIPSLGRTMSFNGTDGYITVPDHLSLDLSQNFSFSAWVNSNDVALQRTILSKDPLGSDANGPYNFYTSSAVGYETNNQGVLWTPAGQLSSDQWDHVTVTHTDAITRIYVNGVERAAADVTNPGVNANSLLIGRRGLTTPDSFFNGRLDDIRIYNRALTPSEVNQIRQEGLGVVTPPGAFGPNTQYQVNICQNNSCAANPILSTQGVPYVIPATFSFETGSGICRVSYVEIAPNPASFIDRRRECLATDLPQCTSATPKTIVAQAKDQTGADLNGFTYTWRETDDAGGTFASEYYLLNQVGSTAAVQHKATIGTDYNFVTADGGATYGSASAQGRMDFYFCENPWLGGAGLTDYYLDNDYDVRLAYCRDADGPNPSDPAGILPNLPNPHLERAGTGFGFGGDLLKEHIFIVGTNVGGTANLTSGNPVITSVSPVQPSYRLGDLVYIKVEGNDPEGDSFVYVKNDEVGDPLPASATFNPRTGVFIWVVDQLPATGNEFSISFSTSPAGTVIPPMPVNITVTQGIPPAPASRPTAEFTTPAEGATITLNYGDTYAFGTCITNAGGACDAGATARSFIWDFQDSGLTSFTDTTAPTYAASHTFVQPGVHQVTFRVQNSASVWSLPAVVNVIVRPRTASLYRTDAPHASMLAATVPLRWFITDVSSLFTRTAWGQSQGAPPTDLSALSIDDASTSNNLVNIQLSWRNAGAYTGVRVYRDGAVIAAALPGTATSYLDTARTIGTDYVYRVCGLLGAQERCSEVTTTARRVDYDIIVARMYKNVGMLSVREWYESYAPNPTGSPTAITVDGYDAIQDGTSVYVGMANCVDQVACSGTPGIYTNILLLSYNAGAQQSTIDIFSQLVNTIRINHRLVNRDNNRGVSDTCSADSTLSCDPGHDAVCQAANAGLCTSAKAELRRDHKRIVDLHRIKADLDSYAAQNHFCNDGTNTRACNTNADCPSGGQCVAAYPALSSGSYIGGVSTSQWPSWDGTLARDLNSTELPVDPINRFGANFYSADPESCLTLTDSGGNPVPGHDVDTCWNERTLQLQCHTGSRVYVYRNRLGTNYNLYANAEARTWNWANIDTRIITTDPTLGGLCTTNAPVSQICGNGVIEGTEVCDGGFRNYCDLNFGEARWNTDFTVGCNPTCTAWGAPGGASIASCNGACGAGYCIGGVNVNRACTSNAQCPGSTCRIQVDAPYEQCDGSAPAGTRCTIGGSPYCSPTCQVSCTEGRPYSGQCGNGTVEAGEVCDDGTGPNGNGSVGRCNTSCSGYGSFCGDGTLTPTDSYDLGCACDTPVPTCNAGYRPIAGASCTRACPGTAHNYSCVKNAEECDTVVGLTSYSCPANTSLYCDSQCNRACTADLRNTASGDRQSVPVYEHYYNVAGDEDNDYTTVKVAATPFTTKNIIFYANAWNGASCPVGPNAVEVRRYESNATDKDVILRTPTSAPDPLNWTSIGTEFCAYTARSLTDPNIVPVYEWYANNDWMYSRSSSTPPVNAAGTNYVLQNSGAPRFWARLGPLQETCGNDLIEGLEECEPASYQVPTAEQATNDNRQYQCGDVFTPNACRMYGGYCGDGVQNDPFEQCDEGNIEPFRCSNAAVSCVDDSACYINNVQGNCLGNGAVCNNNGANCTYCTATCSNGFLARNYCGDGVVNLGLDNIAGNGDAYEEVCDSGTANNGKTGYCNETCSGQTGAVCGNGTIERLCSNNSANDCSDAAEQAACTTGGGTCGGEICDDGTSNGRWTNTCSDNITGCTTDADCGGAPGSCGSGAPRAYCSFSCLGPTVPFCGDSVVQSPNAGPDGRIACSHDTTINCTDGPAGDVFCDNLHQPASPGSSSCNADGINEVCDSGAGVNGTPGECNATCSSVTAGQCGNDRVEPYGTCSITTTTVCANNAGCPATEICTGVESCDPPAAAQLIACTDTSVNPAQPGLQNSECSPACVSLDTQCHAFGLKIWSDGIDVAYLNGNLMLLDDQLLPLQCVDDPAPNGADYADPFVDSPLNDNQCAP